MIAAALLLAAQTAPMAGVQFACDEFTVFAPAADVTESYRGDVRRLYRVESLAPIVGANLGMVFDSLPDTLSIDWRGANKSPVALEISDYDAEAGTAAYSLTFDKTPLSARSTPTQRDGACTAATVSS